MRWNTDCLIRLSLVYRGRAIPLGWKGIEPPSASIAYAGYADLLDHLAQVLWGQTGAVIVLADRGFADTDRMAHLRQRKWHCRIRLKSRFRLYRPGPPPWKVERLFVAPGQAQFWAGVWITDQPFGPVHLAIGQPVGQKEPWGVVSDPPVTVETFEEYGLRFDIEEHFLDDKSKGFHLESSRLRSAPGLERVCLGRALTTRYRVSQGTRIVDQGHRRRVDPPCFRGSSYRQSGWNGVNRALATGQALRPKRSLSSPPDPQPARASHRQAAKRSPPVVLEVGAPAA